LTKFKHLFETREKYSRLDPIDEHESMAHEVFSKHGFEENNKKNWDGFPLAYHHGSHVADRISEIHDDMSLIGWKHSKPLSKKNTSVFPQNRDTSVFKSPSGRSYASVKTIKNRDGVPLRSEAWITRNSVRGH
jgi:hypothetical protein